MVVILVETHRSMTDFYETSLPNATIAAGSAAPDREARAAILGRPSFAVGPVDSVMGSEADSSPSRTLQSRGVQERSLEKTIQHEVNLKESRVAASG